MYKLAAIGTLIAALAFPASAVGKRASAQRLSVQPTCSQDVVFRPGRNYAICDGRFWIREPQTGKVVRVPFWRLQQPSDDPNRP